VSLGPLRTVANLATIAACRPLAACSISGSCRTSKCLRTYWSTRAISLSLRFTHRVTPLPAPKSHIHNKERLICVSTQCYPTSISPRTTTSIALPSHVGFYGPYHIPPSTDLNAYHQPSQFLCRVEWTLELQGKAQIQDDYRKELYISGYRCTALSQVRNQCACVFHIARFYPYIYFRPASWKSPSRP
jgi:hypothetical protein